MKLEGAMIFTCRCFSAAALLAGTVLTSSPALAAEYTSERLASLLSNPRDLELEDIQIGSESPLSNGRVLLEFSATIRNNDIGQWTGVSAGLNDEISTNAYNYLTTSVHWDAFVAVGELATNDAIISLIVDAGSVAAARAEIFSGTIFRPAAVTVSGTNIDAVAQLPLENIVILAEHTLSDGRVLFQINAAVRNQTAEMLREVSILFLNTQSALAYTVPNSGILFGDLASNATKTATAPGFIEVSATELANVRSNILSGAALEISGWELWVFAMPVHPIDYETANGWLPPADTDAAGNVTLIFTNITPLLESLQAGDLLLEDPISRLPQQSPDNPLDPFDGNEPVLIDYLPLLVSSVTISTNEVRVMGQKQLLGEILKYGTFVVHARDAYDDPARDPYDPTVENTYTSEEQAEREEVAGIIRYEEPRDGRLADLDGMFALPFHFNETNILDRVNISGQLFFRQSGLKFELKVKDFQLQRAITRIDAGAVLNLLVEVEGKKPEEEEEETASKNLLPLNPIPALNFNIGGVPVTVQPELTLTAGIEENVPQSLTLPVQSSFLIGMEMGFDRARITGTNDGYFYEPFIEAHPIRVSDPTVFDELELSIEAWAELAFGLKIGVGKGGELKAGPSLGIRLSNRFTLAPFANPWWEMRAGLDLVGHFQMDATILGYDVNLIDLEATLFPFDLFQRDAGGPLIQGMRAANAGGSDGITPILGENVRWAKMFQPAPLYGLSHGFALGVPGSNEIIVGGSGGVSGASSILAKFGPRGDLLWMKDTLPTGGPLMQKAAPLPDGSFFTAGHRGFDLVVSHFDSEGNRNWALAYTADPGITVRNVAATTNRTGQAEFYVTGVMNNGIVTRSDPVVIKLDSTGGIAWAFSYPLDAGDDETHGITISRDGNPIVCGYTAADVAPPPFGTPDPGNVLKNIVASGLLMKVDAESGAIIWAQAYASRWGMSFTDVIEAPDGTIYAGGGASRIVTQTRPSNLFAKFAPDGSLLNHVLVGDDPDWVDELPNGGNSPYDTVTSLIWTPEGLVACGNTGLGTGTAAWVMGLTDELGVKFYSVFDGDNSEDLLAIADVSDGLAVLGTSRSSQPLGQGGEPIALLMKLPWEGIFRFHENTGMRTLFLQPRIYNSGATEEFQVSSSIEIPNAPSIREANSFSGILSANLPVTLTPAAAVIELKTSTNVTFMALEKLDDSGIQNFDDWAAYHRLPDSDPENDTDADGSPDILESYFGQNPWAPDAIPPFTLTSSISNNQQTVVLEFQRQSFARDLDVFFESSEDLETWSPAANVTETVTQSGLELEIVRLGIPVNTAFLFFRATLTDPAP